MVRTQIQMQLHLIPWPSSLLLHWNDGKRTVRKSALCWKMKVNILDVVIRLQIIKDMYHPSQTLLIQCAPNRDCHIHWIPEWRTAMSLLAGVTSAWSKLTKEQNCPVLLFISNYLPTLNEAFWSPICTISRWLSIFLVHYLLEFQGCPAF